MNSSNRETTLLLVTIAAIGVGAYLYTRNKSLKLENNRLKEKNQHLLLLIKAIQNSNHFDNQMKQELLKLIDRFKDIDEYIADEIAEALQLLQIGHVENAIEDLVKIMEHILKSKYKEDNEFISWLKTKKLKFSLHNMLDYAKDKSHITDVEYRFFIAVKTIRNEEDHTLGFKLDKYLSASGLLACISAIMKLGRKN